MSEESMGIIVRHIMLFVKICLAIIILRLILHLCGWHERVPILDDLAEPLAPLANWIADVVGSIWGLLYNLGYKLIH